MLCRSSSCKFWGLFLAEFISAAGLWELFVRVGDSPNLSMFVLLGCSELMLAVYQSLDVLVAVTEGYSELII